MNAAVNSGCRVVVSGIGVVSAIGLNREQFEDSLRAGRCGIRPISRVDPDRLQMKNAAVVDGFDAAAHIDAKRLTMMDRFAQFAVVAAREAAADAGVERRNGLRAAAVVLGSGAGGKTTDDDAFRELYEAGNQRVHPTVIPRSMLSAAVSHVTMDLGIQGPSFAISSACASAAHALGQALWMLRNGAAEIALAGGSEACITLGPLKAWDSMRVVSDICRPFSLGRRGMTLGEGAAVLALETLDHARRRGAKIYAELAGFGMSSDASHLIQPSAEGAARAMQAALCDGRIEPEEVDYINAHGTGTRSNDATESNAVRAVFGGHADALAISSTKSMHGHALGASGALEAAATALGIHGGFVPPTVNFTEADPDCPLDCVPNEAREVPVRVALSNSFAFGGLNAVLALKKVQ